MATKHEVKGVTTTKKEKVVIPQPDRPARQFMSKDEVLKEKALENKADEAANRARAAVLQGPVGPNIHPNKMDERTVMALDPHDPNYPISDPDHTTKEHRAFKEINKTETNTDTHLDGAETPEGKKIALLKRQLAAAHVSLEKAPKSKAKAARVTTLSEELEVLEAKHVEE